MLSASRCCPCSENSTRYSTTSSTTSYPVNQLHMFGLYTNGFVFNVKDYAIWQIYLVAHAGFRATHLAQVAPVCKLHRLQDAAVDQLAHKQQISSLTPHYSAQREHFSSTRCNIHWNTVVTFIFSNRAANCRNFIDNKTTQLHYGTEEVEKEYENGIRFNTNNTSVFKSAVLPFPAVAVNSVCVHHYCHCIECIKN